MDNLGLKIAEQLIAETTPTIALYPGAFKPATRAHFEIVKKAAPTVNEVHVIIANNVREGYTPELSLKIWEQYKKLLPNNVKVYISKDPSPITEIYSIIKEKSNNYLVVYGKGEQDRYNSINENREKYSNVEVIDAGQIGDISATKLREAISKRNKLQIKALIPEGIKVNDFLLNFQLHEIKVNNPTLPFPLKIYSQEKASLIVKELIKNGYKWYGGWIIKPTDKPFTQEGNFEPFFIESESNKEISWDTIEDELDEIKVNKPIKVWDFKSPLKIGDRVKLPSRGHEDRTFIFKGDDILQDTESKIDYSITRMKKMHEYDLEQVKNGTSPHTGIWKEIKVQNPIKKYTFEIKEDLENNAYRGILKLGDKIVNNGRESVLWTKPILDNLPGLFGYNTEFKEEVQEDLLPVVEGTFFRLPLELIRVINNLKEGIDYHARLVDMAKRKDPEALTSLGKTYLPKTEIKVINPTKYFPTDEPWIYYLKDKEAYNKIVKRIDLEGWKDTSPFKFDYYYQDNLHPLVIYSKDNLNYGLPLTQWNRLQEDRLLNPEDLPQRDNLLEIGQNAIKEVLGEIKINKPQLFPLIKPKNWIGKTVKFEDKDQFIDDVYNVNKNFFHFLNIDEESNNSYLKGLLDYEMYFNKTSDMILSDIIEEIIWKYRQENSLPTTNLPYEYTDLIKKFIDKGIINLKEVDELFKDYLDEIKVNKPGINFPLKIETQEQAQQIGKELKKLGYHWWGKEQLDLDNPPFKRNGEFEPITLISDPDEQWGDKTLNWKYVNNLPINESIQTNSKLYIQLLNKLVEECCKELEIEKPIIKLINNDKFTMKNKSYACYIPSSNEVKLVIYGRTLADSCRSLSHELKHAQQQSQGRLTQNAGEDGDEFENEANSFSGKFMREFGRQNPEIYFTRYDEPLNEIKVNKPKRVWDFTKYIPNFKPKYIEIGDKVIFDKDFVSKHFNTDEAIIKDKIYETNDIIEYYTDNLGHWTSDFLIGFNNRNKEKL